MFIIAVSWFLYSSFFIALLPPEPSQCLQQEQSGDKALFLKGFSRTEPLLVSVTWGLWLKMVSCLIFIMAGTAVTTAINSPFPQVSQWWINTNYEHHTSQSALFLWNSYGHRAALWGSCTFLGFCVLSGAGCFPSLTYKIRWGLMSKRWWTPGVQWAVVFWRWVTPDVLLL